MAKNPLNPRNRNDNERHYAKKILEYYELFDSYLYVQCPNCLSDLSDLYILDYSKKYNDFKPDYCPYCGQAIIWGTRG